MKTKIFFLSIVLLGALNVQGYSQSDSLKTESEDDKSNETVETTTVTISTKAKEDQFQTIFASNKKAFGGYFGIISHYSQFNDQGAVLLGGELSTVINHSFNLGVKGYGSITKIKSNRSSEFGNPLYIGIGYGGINLEPVLYYNAVVHVSFPVLLGGGALAEYSTSNYNYNYYYYTYNYDYFFVFEPGISLELNIVKFMKLSTGASYRVTSGVNVVGYDGADLNGFNLDLSLKFGCF